MEITKGARANGQRVARVLLAGMLAVSVGSGAVVAHSRAWAEEGTVRIVHVANKGAVYDVYQVFTADVDASNKASHIAWASDGVKEAVLGFLDSGPEATGAAVAYSEWLASSGRTASGAHDNAQNAAEYIAAMIAASATAPNTDTQPATRAAGSFASALARQLAGSGIQPGTAVDGEDFTAAEGYYLFVSRAASIGRGASGTAPLWIPVGGSYTVVRAKEAAASSTFAVQEDSTAAWGAAADARNGQDLAYRRTLTLPANIGAYPSFHVHDAIALPEGMDLAAGDASSVAVSVAGEDVTPAATVGYADGVLTVDIPDLLSVRGVDVDANAAVQVDFRAHLTGDAARGAAGNLIVARYTYTADPVSLADGAAADASVACYTYAGIIVKVDKSTRDALPGAEFTVSTEGQYVQADGTLGAEPHGFVTDAQGELSLPSLDEGEYTVAEVRAPSGYQVQDTDIRLVVASEIDAATGALAGLTATVAGGEAASVAGDEATRLVSVERQTGLIVVQAVDDREFELAAAGLSGNAALFAVAGALASCGAGGALLLRRREDDAEPGAHRRPSA